MWSLSVGEEDLFFAEHSAKHEDVLRTYKATKKPQPKLQPPSALERIFGKGLSKPRYLTAASSVNEHNRKDISKEPSPFKYPDDLEDFSHRVMTKVWRQVVRKNESKLRYNQRQSCRSKQTEDLLNRLWVKDPEVKGGKTILDIDKQFFEDVQGRSGAQIGHKDYIRDLRDVLRLNIVIRYKEDEIMLFDENHLTEQRVFEHTSTEFQKYVATFEDFLFMDHTSSLALLRRADEETQAAWDAWEERKELSKKYGLLNASVYKMEEKWRTCKMYQQFLYTVSPMDWRRQHDFYVRFLKGSIDTLQLHEDDSSSSMFRRYKLDTSHEPLSFVNLINQFLEDIKVPHEPLLYFTNPTELVTVFTFLELQNLNTMMHIEDLVTPLQQLNLEIANMKNLFDTQGGYLTDIIHSLERGIIWEEEREVYLEQLGLELINGEFKALISSDEVISLYVFIQDVYETSSSSKDEKLSTVDMMKAIEATYLKTTLMLDRLPDDIVGNAEMHCYSEQGAIMVNAKKAARELMQVELLSKQLDKILSGFTPGQLQRALKWRSPPLDKIQKPPSAPKPLTEAEIDYLTYFVDYCENNDDPKDFGIRVAQETQGKRI